MREARPVRHEPRAARARGSVRRAAPPHADRARDLRRALDARDRGRRGSRRAAPLRRPSARSPRSPRPGAHRAVVCGTAGRFALPGAWLGAKRARVPFVLWTALWAHPRTPAHRRRRSAAARRAVPRCRRRRRVRAARRGLRPRARRAQRARRAAGRRQRVLGRRRWSVERTVPFIAVLVGRASWAKGAAVLLDAWRRSGFGDTAALVLVGAGSGPPRIPAGGAVAFVGPQPPEQVRNFLAAADVCVMPSLRTRDFREPWGLVANEAMNQSTPIIASDEVGAVAGGLVRHERNGLVVPRRRPRGAERRAAAPARRRRAARAARRERAPRRRAVHVRRVGRRLRRGDRLATLSRSMRYPPTTLLLPSALLAGAPRRARLRQDGHQRLHRRRGPVADLHPAGVPRRAEQLPADADQYGNCRDIIARAQEAAATKGSKGARRRSADKARRGTAARTEVLRPARRRAARRRDAGRSGRGARRPRASPPTTPSAPAAPSPRATSASSPRRAPRRTSPRPSSCCSRCCSQERSRSPPSASEALSTPAALDERARAGTLSVPGLQAQPLLTTGLAAILCAVAFAADGGLQLARATPVEIALIVGGGLAVAGLAAAGPAPRAAVGHRAARPAARARRAHGAVDHMGRQPDRRVGRGQPRLRLRRDLRRGGRARARRPAPLGRGARRDHAGRRRHQRLRGPDEDRPRRAERRRAVRAPVRAVRLLEQRRPDGGARGPRPAVARHAAHRPPDAQRARLPGARARPAHDAAVDLARSAGGRGDRRGVLARDGRSRCACAPPRCCCAASTGAGAAAAWAFSQGALSDDRVPLGLRETAGLQLALLVVVLLARADARRPRGRLRRRRAGRRAGARAGGSRPCCSPASRSCPSSPWARMALGDRGLSDSISSRWTSLTDPDARAAVQRRRPPDGRRQRARDATGTRRCRSSATTPAVGVGAGGYATARKRYRGPGANAVRTAHGYGVQTLADLGLAGLAVSLALLAAWLASAAAATGLRPQASRPRPDVLARAHRAADPRGGRARLRRPLARRLDVVRPGERRRRAARRRLGRRSRPARRGGGAPRARQPRRAPARRVARALARRLRGRRSSLLALVARLDGVAAAARRHASRRRRCARSRHGDVDARARAGRRRRATTIRWPSSRCSSSPRSSSRRVTARSRRAPRWRRLCACNRPTPSPGSKLAAVRARSGPRRRPR